MPEVAPQNFTPMPSSTDHISVDVLADLVEKRVPLAEQEPLMAHLQACADCSLGLQKLDHLVGLMRTDDSVDAPQPLIARALNIFQRQPRQQAASPSLPRRVVAAVSFDSLSAEPVFGFRSGQAETRQLIFSAEEIDIDLRIAPRGDRWNVSGQVLGAECAGGEVQLQSETVAESTRLSELCEFALTPVASGSYRLRLRLEDVEVEFPEIALKA